MNGKLRLIGIMPLLLLALQPALRSQSLGPNAPTFKGSAITSGRPLSDAADVLQARYGKPVTYEDPVWAWSGDAISSPVRPTAIVPLQRTMAFPAGLTPDETPTLDAGVLIQVLSEYEKLNDAPRFRVVTSRFGLHIIPDMVRGADGNLGFARSPLDANIAIPRAVRTATAHLGSICDAAAPLADVTLVCSAAGFNEDWFEKLFAAPQGKLEWGSSGTSARDALLDLLGGSATTFSWRLNCVPGAPHGQYCVLNVVPIPVLKPDRQGIVRVGRLEYDRCSTCAPPPRDGR